MSYKGVITKIQSLKAYYDFEIETTKQNKLFYNPQCTKEEYIKIMQKFSDDLDLLLRTEEYSMKKHFKD